MLKKLKTIIAYIFFEGLSRGGNQIILLYLSIILVEEQFVSILLLFSLESLIVVLAPLNYIESLYAFISNYSKRKILMSLFGFKILITLFLILLYYSFKSYLVDYYQISSSLVYVSIIFISLGKVYLRIVSFLYQIEEHHKKSIQIKSISYFVPLIFGIIGLLFETNKIHGFFIGRAIGYLLLYGYYFFYFNVRWKEILLFEMSVIKEFFQRSKYLMANGITGWLLGYGVINIVSFFQPVSTTAQIGYLLNIWMILLLMANGINSVYEPRLKNLFFTNKRSSKSLTNLVHLLYISIGLLGIVVSYFLVDLISLPEELVKFKRVIPFAFLLLIIQSFQYVSIPYFYFTNNYKKLSTVVIISSILSIAFLTFNLYKFSHLNTLLLLFTISYLFKTLPVYVYSKKLIL